MTVPGPLADFWKTLVYYLKQNYLIVAEIDESVAAVPPAHPYADPQQEAAHWARLLALALGATVESPPGGFYADPLPACAYYLERIYVHLGGTAPLILADPLRAIAYYLRQIYLLKGGSEPALAYADPLRAAARTAEALMAVIGPPPFLLDALSQAPVRAYAFCKLRSAYSGPCAQLRRSSDNALQDIGFDSNGEFDTAAAAAFIGAGTGAVRIWYDQMGSGNPISQTSNNSNQAIYVAAAINNKPGMDLASKYMFISLSLNDPITWSTVVKPNASVSSGTYCAHTAPSYDGNTSFSFFFGFFAPRGKFGSSDGSGYSDSDLYTTVTKHLLAKYQSGSNNPALYVNGGLRARDSVDGYGGTANPGCGPINSRMCEWIIWNVVLSEENRAIVNAYTQERYGIAPP